MRIALLSDIHGNSVALQAALDDIQARGGVDSYWVLGDLCAIGYDPVGVLERLSKLPNLIAIRGNADRYASSFDLPPPTLEDALANNTKIETLVEVAGNFGWTRGALDATGWTNWLRDLPYDYTLHLPDGTKVLLVHADPKADDKKGLNPSLTDEELADVLVGVDAGLVCVGHFHNPMRRYFRDRQIVNPGSVSNTFNGDTRSYYAILEATGAGFDFKFYAVTYDLEKAIQLIHQTLNIGNNFNNRVLRGGWFPSWKRNWDGRTHLPPIEPEL